MAWIFLAVSGESQKLSKDTLPPSLTVKMTDTHKRYSYHEWLQETSRLHQYGMTLPRFGEPTFLASILSMEDSPAKTFPLQAAEKAWEESAAVFSSRSLGLSASYDLASCSWRTSQRLLFEEQNELLGNFAAYGMTVDGAFFPLLTWERITDENDGGYWPTPNTEGWRSDGEMNALALMALDAQEYVDLSHRASKNRRKKWWYRDEELPSPRGRVNPEFWEWLMGYPR